VFVDERGLDVSQWANSIEKNYHVVHHRKQQKTKKASRALGGLTEKVGKTTNSKRNPRKKTARLGKGQTKIHFVLVLV